MTATQVAHDASVFRFATRRDLVEPAYMRLFKEMEAVQSRFYRVQRAVEGPPYIWPLRPLYEWSRRIEYPFAASCLPTDAHLRILDAGSGVTFFPFYLRSRTRGEVECLDTQPDYPARMRQVCRLLDCPEIPFHVGDLSTELPLDDERFDAVLCISVLEHLPPAEWLGALTRLWRLVRPGGRLILTMDVSLTGEAEGVLLADVPRFQCQIEQVLGPIPDPGALTGELLTPQQPGFGLCPLRIPVRHKDRILRRVWPWSRRRWKADTLGFWPLACLLLCVRKDGNRSGEENFAATPPA